MAMVPLGLLGYLGRVFSYGATKYAPGNYIHATLEDDCGQRYFSAALRHMAAMQDVGGMWTRESMSRLDEESGLPHLFHLIASLLMLAEILHKEGVLL